VSDAVTRMMTFRVVAAKHVSGWTDVRIRSFTDDGKLGPEVTINSFGGSNKGRPEAERLAELLNDAVDTFYASRGSTEDSGG
jgi:hypothetical protein